MNTALLAVLPSLTFQNDKRGIVYDKSTSEQKYNSQQ